MNYRFKRTVEIEARQFTGSNLDDFRGFCPGRYYLNWNSKKEFCLYDFDFDFEIVISPGSYLVKFPFEHIAVFSQTAFNDLFEKPCGCEV